MTRPFFDQNLHPRHFCMALDFFEIFPLHVIGQFQCIFVLLGQLHTRFFIELNPSPLPPLLSRARQNMNEPVGAAHEIRHALFRPKFTPSTPLHRARPFSNFATPRFGSLLLYFGPARAASRSIFCRIYPIPSPISLVSHLSCHARRNI